MVNVGQFNSGNKLFNRFLLLKQYLFQFIVL